MSNVQSLTDDLVVNAEWLTSTSSCRKPLDLFNLVGFVHHLWSSHGINRDRDCHESLNAFTRPIGIHRKDLQHQHQTASYLSKHYILLPFAAEENHTW